MNLATSNNIPKKYSDFLPTLDAYLAEHLTEEHKTFYTHLLKERYLTDKIFSVDFDVLYEHAGYTYKGNAKRFLKEHFKENVEYKVLIRSDKGSEEWSVPANKEDIFLTIKAAQQFAMMSGTKNSKIIIEFFVTFVEIIQDYHLITLYHEKQNELNRMRHDTLIKSFANKNVLYQAHVGLIEGEDIDKIGHTEDIQSRMTTHHRELGPDTILLDVIEHEHHRLLEKYVKNDPLIKGRLRKREINGKNQTELIAFDANFTRDKYRKIVNKIADEMMSYRDSLNETEIRKLELEKQTEKQKYDLEMANLEMERQKVNLEIEKQKTAVEIEKQKSQQLQMQTQNQLEMLRLQLEMKKLELQQIKQDTQNIDKSVRQEEANEQETPAGPTEDLARNREHLTEDTMVADEGAAENVLAADNIREIFRLDPRHMKPITPEEYALKRRLIREKSMKKGLNAATSYVSQTICSSQKFRSKQSLIKQKRQGVSRLEIALNEIFEPVDKDGKRVLKQIWKEKHSTKGVSFTTQDLFDAALRYLYRNFEEFTTDGVTYAIE